MTNHFDYKNIKMPNLSTLITIGALLFAGGQWYSGHQTLVSERKQSTAKIEKLQDQYKIDIDKVTQEFESDVDEMRRDHNEDIKALNALIAQSQNIQNETLRKMGIISNELGHIRRAIEKLEKGT